MSIKIADRVKETSLTQGTGTLTLDGAFGGFQSFSSAIGDGNSTYYAIENESRWEVGIGTYTSSSNTLSRDTVLKSSSGTSKIDISGVAIVFCSYPADKAIVRDENGDVSESGLLTLTRDSAGNFIHMYKDDSYDRTISIYTDGNASPGWRMGVKNSPSSETEAPSEGYVYGKDGQVGLVGNSSNSITLSNTTDFTVKHNNASLIKASASTGIHLNANSAAYPAITINGAAAQSQPLTEWTDSAGNVLSIVDKDGNIAINKTSASYELDVDGSGRLESVYLTSGIYFQDGTFQTTAHSDVLTNQVSGWADNTITSRDNAVSGYFETRTDQNTNDIVLVSGIAAYASGHNLQSITDNGSSTTNSISSSGNVTATTGILDVLDLTLLENGSQPSYSEGVVFYDSENHTLSLYNDEADVTLQLGQEEFLRVRNNTGGTIYNGSGVRIVGSHGNAAPTVEPAIASTEQKSQIVGLATHDIENNSFGYVTTYGVVRDVNTVGFSAGDELFLDASASGNLTNIPPTIPNYKVTIGHVIRSHANGSILVQVGHPKLGGGDLKSETVVTLSGVPFVASIADTNAGGMQTNSSFVYDSGNNQLQLGSGVQLLNAVPGNTTNVLYNDGGTLKFNGSAIAGAGDVTTEQLEGVSGIAVYASGQTDNNTADILTVSGLLYDDASLSGYVDSRDTAVSGWTKAYVDSQDHSATAVSGWANATFVTSDNDTTYTAGSGLELHGTEFQAAISGANLLATNTPTDDYVPSYDAATGKLTWVANAGDGGATYTAGSGLVLDGDNKFHSTFASGNYLLGEIRDNSSSGVVISGIANANVSNIATNAADIIIVSGIANTTYGWGDHSSAGYLTSETSHSDVLVDGDFGSQGIMKRGASAGNYSIITDNSSNWNTAYSWGDHSTQGYLTSDSDTTYTGDSGVLLQGTVFNANLVDYTVQSTAANSRTTTASRTYAVQVDSSDKLVVNVPWVDTNTDNDTTYTAGSGLELHGTEFQAAISGANLLATNTPSDNQLASYDAATGKFTWVSAAGGGSMSNFIITDGSTPQTVDNGETITFADGVGAEFVTSATNTVTVNSVDSEIVHDDLSGFVSNEHINHTSVTLTAGDGLSGGGDISANRTFTVVGDSGILVTDKVHANLVDYTVQTTAANSRTTTASRTYAVQVDSSDQLVVNVPWSDTDTDTTYSTATSSALGLVKIEDDTEQSVAANTVSTTAGRTYGVQLNSDDQLVVNVPWSDTDTTYSEATSSSEGLMSTAHHDKLDGIEASADVTDATNVTAAGALMDSEVTNLAQVKAFDSSDYAPAAGSSSVVTVGTVTAGTWQGTAIADGYIASAATWNAKQAALTFGIANTNAVKIDAADVADNEYARFTANGLESRTIGEIKTELSLAKGDVDLGNVENTALSTWAGTTNITTIGTISNGTWQGTAIGSSYIADAFLKNNADDTTSGTVTMANLIIANAGNIGSASDTDAIAIASGGDVTFSQTVTSNGYKMSSGGYTTITGTSHTLAEADDGKVLLFTNGSAITLTIPAGLTLGHSCTVIQQGAGQITFTPSSTTLRNRQGHTKTAGQYARVGLIHYQESSVSNFYNLGGDTAS